MRKSTLAAVSLLAFGATALTAAVNYSSPAAVVIAEEAADVTWTSVPANGANVDASEAELIYVTFNGMDLSDPELGDVVPSATFNGSDAHYEFKGIKGNTLTFGVARGYDTPQGDGTFVFTIPAGYLIANGVNSPEVVVTFNVGGTGSETPGEFQWTANPANESVVNDVNTFSITFPGVTTIDEGEGGFEATFNDEDCTVNWVVKVNGNTLNFAYNTRTTSGPLSGEGVLQFTFNKGAFLLDGVETEEFGYAIMQKPEQTPDPADGNLLSYVTTGDPAPFSIVQKEDMGEWAFPANAGLEAVEGSTEEVTLKCNGVVVASGSVEDGTVYGFPDEGFSVIGFSFTGDLGAEGKYELTVPDGVFTLDGKPVPGATFIAYNGIGTFTPAPGEVSVVDGAWKKVSLTPFEGVNLYDLEVGDGHSYGTEEKATLTCDGEVINEFSLETLMFFRNKIDMAFKNAVDKNGDYVLSFPENFFMTTDASGKNIGSPELSYEFTIKDGKDANAPEQTYVVGPEAGFYKVFPAVTITYDNFDSITVNEGAEATLVVANATVAHFNITAEGNVVTLTPTADYTTPASTENVIFHVMVPANSYMLETADGSWRNDALDITNFKIEQPSCPEVIADPASGSHVEDLDNLVITCTIDGVITGVNTLTAVSLYKVVDGARSGAAIFKYNIKFTKDDNAFTLTPKDHATTLEDGEYEVELKAQLYRVTVGGKAVQSKAQSLFYILATMSDGVDRFVAEKNVTVFNVNGVRVLDNAPKSELNNLGKGLYIVNGKKMIIR